MSEYKIINKYNYNKYFNNISQLVININISTKCRESFNFDNWQTYVEIIYQIAISINLILIRESITRLYFGSISTK